MSALGKRGEAEGGGAICTTPGLLKSRASAVVLEHVHTASKTKPIRRAEGRPSGLTEFSGITVLCGSPLPSGRWFSCQFHPLQPAGQPWLSAVPVPRIHTPGAPHQAAGGGGSRGVQVPLGAVFSSRSPVSTFWLGIFPLARTRRV